MASRPRGAASNRRNVGHSRWFGAGQAAAFLADRPGWRAAPPPLPLGRPHGPAVRLSPFHDETDGFLIARLEKA